MLILFQSPVLAQIPVSEQSDFVDLGWDGTNPEEMQLLERSSPARQAFDVKADSYIIGPGDTLELKVFSSPELSGPLPVLNDGTVSLPLIGSVRVQGLTPQQASRWVQDLFSKDLLSPELQISVLTPRPLQISLIGEVQRPGLYIAGGNICKICGLGYSTC